MVWFKWPAITPQKLAACSAAAKKLTTIEGVLAVDFGTFNELFFTSTCIALYCLHSNTTTDRYQLHGQIERIQSWTLRQIHRQGRFGILRTSSYPRGIQGHCCREGGYVSKSPIHALDDHVESHLGAHHLRRASTPSKTPTFADPKP